MPTNGKIVKKDKKAKRQKDVLLNLRQKKIQN